MLISADGGTPKQVTFGGYHHLSPTWSPDGRHLACRFGPRRQFRYLASEPHDSTLEQLTFHPDNDREPAWNADGTMLAFVRDNGAGPSALSSSILSLRPGAKPRFS